MTPVPRRLSLRVLLLALLLCVAGCQAPVGTARPGPTGAPPQDRRLSAADARLYRGDYEGAEAAYRALLSDGVTGAAAHLSTLLAYENRFDEAVTQGRAGVASHADSESLARLTRALDWAQDVDEAVATGARAVATRPVSPLAHVFYSEALADAGRFDDAAPELRSAEDAGGGAFVQGEVYREWANYYRGRKDSQSELNFSELAVKAQPAFPERQLDMVRFDYGNQRPVVARTVADKLLAAHPHDYRLLIAAADAALSGGDGQRAPQFYRAPAQASPDAPEAALGVAEPDGADGQGVEGAHRPPLGALA